MRRLITFRRSQRGRWFRLDNGYTSYRCGWGAVGILFNSKALWVGAHYGEHHKRWCINILPCLTVWWAKPGGYLP